MNNHLEDHHISTAVAGLDLDSALARHLDSCVSCRARVLEFRELVDARRRTMDAATPDWQAQCEAILDRLHHHDTHQVVPLHRPRWRHRMVALAAVFLAALALTSIVYIHQAPNPTVAKQDIAVDELLAEVDAMLEDDSIPGLWPVDPLTDNSELESLISNETS